MVMDTVLKVMDTVQRFVDTVQRFMDTFAMVMNTNQGVGDRDPRVIDTVLLDTNTCQMFPRFMDMVPRVV